MNADFLAMTAEESRADQPSEFNAYVLSVPYALWVSYLKQGTDTLTANSGLPTTADQIDQRFADLVFDFSDTGDQYFGGDDPQGTTSDIPGDQGTTESPEDTADGTDAAAGSDGMHMGPLGVVRHLSMEDWLQPWGSTGTNKCRFYAQEKGPIQIGRSGPAMCLFGIVRYNVDAETNFAVEADSADTINALNRLFGGDVHRTNIAIQRHAGGMEETVRNLLFGGDQFVEADTAKEDGCKFYLKWSAMYSTPYTQYDIV